MCFIHSSPYEIRVLTVIIVIILIIIIIIIRAQVFCQLTAVELVYWTDYQLPKYTPEDEESTRHDGQPANRCENVTYCS